LAAGIDRWLLAAGGIERHEVVADINVDVVHAAVSHGAAGLVVGNQPTDHLALAGAGIEVDGLAAGMLRAPSGAGNHRPRTTGGDDLHFAEMGFDAVEQGSRRRRQATARGAALAVARGGVIARDAAAVERFCLLGVAAVGISDAMAPRRGSRGAIGIVSVPAIVLEIVGARAGRRGDEAEREAERYDQKPLVHRNSYFCDCHLRSPRRAPKRRCRGHSASTGVGCPRLAGRTPRASTGRIPHSYFVSLRWGAGCPAARASNVAP